MKFQALNQSELLAVIEAPTWFDARHYALGKFGEGALVEEDKKSELEPTVELKWVGTDAGSGKDRRHLELRERATAQEPWGEWASP